MALAGKIEPGRHALAEVHLAYADGVGDVALVEASFEHV